MILTPNNVGFIDGPPGQLISFALQTLECIKMTLPVGSPILEGLIGGREFSTALVVIRKQRIGHQYAHDNMALRIVANEARPVSCRLMQFVGFVQTSTCFVDFRIDLIGAQVIGCASAFKLSRPTNRILTASTGTGIASAASRQGESQDEKYRERSGATNGPRRARLEKHQSAAGGFRVHCRGRKFSGRAGTVLMLIWRYAKRVDSDHIFYRPIRAMRRPFGI